MKKVIRGIAFLVITAIVILGIYNVLRWKDTTGGYLSTTSQLYATENDLIDIVFLGSSHCYCGINPDILWGEYGYSAFGMTISGQDKLSTYYHLNEVLKTQSPKVVCVELWGLTYDEYGVEGNQHRNMMAMDLSENSVELVKAAIEDEDEQMEYILRWPIVHTRYKELGKYDFVPYGYSQYGRSAEMLFESGWSQMPTEAIACDEIGELTSANKEWLENLYQLSEEKDFKLVLFVAPTMLDIEQQKQINGAKEFAQKRGVTFFDFNRMLGDIGLDYEKDFTDQTHLNGYGAEKLTRYIGTYFKQNFKLDDHRGDENYYQWQESYNFYEHALKNKEISEITDIPTYFTTLSKLEGYTCLVSFEGTYYESTLDMKMYTKILGVTKEQYELGGTFLIKDGEVTHLLDNNSEEIVSYELNEYDSFKVQNMELVTDEKGGFYDIEFNMESVGSAINGINVVVYDDVMQKIIDKRGYY